MNGLDSPGPITASTWVITKPSSAGSKFSSGRDKYKKVYCSLNYYQW